jgi:pimeloyl-ACP methyl ester carboxylesterase
MDATVWAPLWEALPGWTHVGVDLWGHGGSPPLPPGADLPALADEVIALAASEGARHVVGLSFGGMLALQVAIQWGAGLASLVLGSAPLGGGPQDPHAATRSRELTRLYEQRGPGEWMTALWMRSPPDIFRGAAAQPELWERLQQTVDRHRWEELEDESMRGVVDHPQSAHDLRRVEAATLIVVGDEDMPSVKRCAELMRRSIPGARRVYARGAGHLSLLESPEAAELIAAHLRGAITSAD